VSAMCLIYTKRDKEFEDIFGLAYASSETNFFSERRL
jgi:hypothetical protein